MALDKAKVREWLQDSGGYDILDPQFFLEMGVEPEVVERFTRTFSDDPELGKHAVTRADGKPGPARGVSEFSMIQRIAYELGVDLSKLPQFYGRGKTFRTQVSAILKAL
jgi:hypothetical protein